MTFGKIIDKIIDFYFEAVSNDSIVKPFSWAVYQTWKWVDKRERKRGNKAE